MKTNLWLVIPCYNEEEILEYSMGEVRGLMEKLQQQDKKKLKLLQ